MLDAGVGTVSTVDGCEIAVVENEVPVLVDTFKTSSCYHDNHLKNIMDVYCLKCNRKFASVIEYFR